jgi:hypothetical protein
MTDSKKIIMILILSILSMSNQTKLRISAVFSAIKPNNCYKCQAGYYSDVEGLKNCKPCPIGQ